MRLKGHFRPTIVEASVLFLKILASKSNPSADLILTASSGRFAQ